MDHSYSAEYDFKLKSDFGYRRFYRLNLPPESYFYYTTTNGMTGRGDNATCLKWDNTCESVFDSDDVIIAGSTEKSHYIIFGALTAYRSLTHFALMTRARRFHSIWIWMPDIREGEEPEQLFIKEGSDWRELLKEYAETAARINHVKDFGKPSNTAGYCSWYYYYKDLSQAVFLENVEALGKARANGEYLPQIAQIDDGYQTFQGDWLDLSPDWPESLESVAAKIQKNGMIPGIWTMPFTASTASRVFHDHPDWFLHEPNGEISISHGWSNPPDHLWGCLDLTHPEVLEHLRKIFRQLRAWGYRYFKMDGLVFSMKEGIRHDQNATPVSAFRQGLKTIVESVPDGIFLSCCPLFLPCLGITDHARVSEDTRAERNCMMFAAHLSISRWWMADRWFRCDPDVLYVRSAGDRSELTPGECRISVAAACVTGVALTSDHTGHLNKEQFRLLRKSSELRVYKPFPAKWQPGCWLNVFTGEDAAGKPAAVLINDTEKEQLYSFAELGLPEQMTEELHPLGLCSGSVKVPPFDAVFLSSK